MEGRLWRPFSVEAAISESEFAIYVVRCNALRITSDTRYNPSSDPEFSGQRHTRVIRVFAESSMEEYSKRRGSQA
jgi:hypothetical protein